MTRCEKKLSPTDLEHIFEASTFEQSIKKTLDENLKKKLSKYYSEEARLFDEALQMIKEPRKPTV